MARPGLMVHPKFRRLCRTLALPPAHVRGYLELLWETAYQNGEPSIGDAVDVELAAGWTGVDGELSAALLGAGGNGRAGFIEEIEPGRYGIHDLFDHAPRKVVRQYTPRLRAQAKQYRRARRAATRGACNELSADQWRAVLEFFGNRCAYCLAELLEATQDHLKPLSAGGQHHPDNVVPSCRSCNSAKGSKGMLQFVAGRRR